MSGNMFKRGEKRRECDRGSTLCNTATHTRISIGRIQHEDTTFFQKKRPGTQIRFYLFKLN